MKLTLPNKGYACVNSVKEWIICIVPIASCEGERGDIDIYFNKEEQGYLKSLHFHKRQREWKAGRIAAKLALRSYCVSSSQKVPELVDIFINNSQCPENNGQPVTNLKAHISISHSNKYAVAVASPYAVGVDIERVHTFSSGVQKMILNNKEFDLFDGRRDSHEIDQCMTLIWSFKEAFMKVFGQSVFGWLKEIQLLMIHSNGDLTWKLSPKLTKFMYRKEAQYMHALGIIIEDYALAVVGKRVSFKNTVEVKEINYVQIF